MYVSNSFIDLNCDISSKCVNNGNKLILPFSLVPGSTEPNSIYHTP